MIHCEVAKSSGNQAAAAPRSTRTAGDLARLARSRGATAVLWLGLFGAAWAQGAAKFPAKGVVTVGTGPLPLFVHYLNGSGLKVKTSLRDLSYAPPDLALSKELQLLALRPCAVGDQVILKDSRIEGKTTGADAAGIGRFVWLVSGRYASDGRKWQFNGTVAAKDDLYNFNKSRDGARSTWAEVSTRLGSKFDGKEFWIQITGSLPVSINGVCSLDSKGQALV